MQKREEPVEQESATVAQSVDVKVRLRGALAVLGPWARPKGRQAIQYHKACDPCWLSKRLVQSSRTGQRKAA